MLFQSLARATRADAFVALVDLTGGFEPRSAAAAGVVLDRLLWVRCGSVFSTALRVVDVVVRGGGFELVAVDLGDLPPWQATRVPGTAFVRLQRAVERTSTALVFAGRQRVAGSMASLAVALSRGRVEWAPGGPGLLVGLAVEACLIRTRDRAPGGTARLQWRLEPEDRRPSGTTAAAEGQGRIVPLHGSGDGRARPVAP